MNMSFPQTDTIEKLYLHFIFKLEFIDHFLYLGEDEPLFSLPPSSIWTCSPKSSTEKK